jgi:antitoxin component YwqK of YwqJK toxin-antitoxin module
LSLTNFFGEYKYYHEDGHILKVCNYVNNKKEGEYKYFDENGNLFGVFNYINGTLQK